MTLHTYGLYLAAVLLISATPGPNIFYVTTRSIRFGFGPAMLAMTGCLLALALMLTASVAGVSAFMLAVPTAFEALKYAVSLINEQGGWGKFKSFRDTWDFFGGKNEFARDQVGAFPMEDWYYNVLAENSPQVKITAEPFTDRHYAGGRPVCVAVGADLERRTADRVRAV